jgi:hypothetical protein
VYTFAQPCTGVFVVCVYLAAKRWHCRHHVYGPAVSSCPLAVFSTPTPNRLLLLHHCLLRCRQCSSGLQAIADVAAAIKAGYYSVGLAAGAGCCCCCCNLVCYVGLHFLLYAAVAGACTGDTRQQQMVATSTCLYAPCLLPAVSTPTLPYTGLGLLLLLLLQVLRPCQPTPWPGREASTRV